MSLDKEKDTSNYKLFNASLDLMGGALRFSPFLLWLKLATHLSAIISNRLNIDEDSGWRDALCLLFALPAIPFIVPVMYFYIIMTALFVAPFEKSFYSIAVFNGAIIQLALTLLQWLGIGFVLVTLI